MFNDKKLQQAVLGVMLGKKESQVDEALKGNQHKIDKNKNGKVDGEDFKILRGENKQTNEENIDEAQVEEAMSHQAKTTMKHIPNASPALKKAAKDIKPGIKGYQDRVDMLKAGGVKEELEIELDEHADETVYIHAPIEYELKESYTFNDYLNVAKQMVSEDEAIKFANEKFTAKDTTVFAEEFMRSDIEDRVKTHQKAGHKVSSPKYSTKGGKPYAEYTVTDKESGVRRKYIHHGNSRSVENLGAAGQKD